MQLESWNLRICWAKLREAHSHGNTKYTITMGFDGTFGDTMVMTFLTVTTDMKKRMSISSQWLHEHVFS
jgi:hypothetical protein